ncbi:hypothetical protein ACH41H_02405 [Streptomyces sp. NPDC020800]|uniref:hypothetical protein n=1 Tax=Streptomyces sp. NPDC020800 TaxID=3365092 RepID=UPI0037978288
MVIRRLLGRAGRAHGERFGQPSGHRPEAPCRPAADCLLPVRGGSPGVRRVTAMITSPVAMTDVLL